jgi:pimeloyl-ACP methyl ester carboxylesterase
VSDETSDEGPGDRRAHRPDPRFEGDLVRVVQAINQAEAEFVQALLREEGIPSMLRRTRGFDVPDMLAAGRRDVMVPQTGHASAREVLLQAEIVRDEPTRMAPPARRPAALPTRAVRRLLKSMGIYPPA